MDSFVCAATIKGIRATFKESQDARGEPMQTYTLTFESEGLDHTEARRLARHMLAGHVVHLVVKFPQAEIHILAETGTLSE